MVANTNICLTQHWGEGRAPHICRWIVMETQVFQLNVTTIVSGQGRYSGRFRGQKSRNIGNKHTTGMESRQCS